MAIGEQGNFDQGDQNAGKQGNQGNQEELYVRVQAETGGKGPFSGGASSTVKGLLNNLEIEQTQGTPRTRPDAQPEPRTRSDAQPEARTRPDAQQAGQGGERDVVGPNGSKIHLSSKFPDGKERPTEITEPDGVRHAYRWQEVGGKIICTAIADLSPQGQMTATGRLMQDQKTWKLKAGNYPEIPVEGALTVDTNGVHRFKETATGNTFTRNPDGSATYKDSSGRDIPGHPLVRGPKTYDPSGGMRPKK